MTKKKCYEEKKSLLIIAKGSRHFFVFVDFQCINKIAKKQKKKIDEN